MSPGRLLQLRLVQVKVKEIRLDLGTLIKRSRQSQVDLLGPDLLLYLHCLHLQRFHRKRTLKRTILIDLALDDHLAQHMTLVRRRMKDHRGPNGILERLWQDCDQPPGW